MSISRGFIDFAAVKAAVSLQQILDHYGLFERLAPSGAGSESLRGCCPIHEGINPSQFSVTLAKNAWNCFSECRRGGNQLDLVAALEKCTISEAAWKVNEWFNLGHEKQARQRAQAPQSGRQEAPTPRPVRKSAPKAEKKPTGAQRTEATANEKVEAEEETGANKPLEFALKNLDPAHPYLSERGLHVETIDELGLAYCPKGIMAGRIVIPIHNPAGELVAYAGRWPGEPPEGKEKYRLPGGFKKALEVFNLHRAIREPEEKPLIVTEGYFGALALWQWGYRRVVSIMGSSLSTRQTELLLTHATRRSGIILLFDEDAAGRQGREQAVRRLAEHTFVRVAVLPREDAQPDHLTAEELHLLLD